jgi:hypothetical protein
MIRPEYQSVAEIPSISVNGGTSFVRVENDGGDSVVVMVA